MGSRLLGPWQAECEIRAGSSVHSAETEMLCAFSVVLFGGAAQGSHDGPPCRPGRRSFDAACGGHC